MNKLRYLEADAAWLFASSSHTDLEVIVSGSFISAEPERVDLIEQVLGALPDVTRTAKSYLDEFVHRQKFASGNEWFLEGVSSRSPENQENEFSLQFSIDGDTYGSWSVNFKKEVGRYWPVAFTRRNY